MMEGVVLSVSCEAIADVDAAIVACDAFGRWVCQMCAYIAEKKPDC